MANKSYLKTIQFSAIVIAFSSVTSFAGPTLQNGDFSAGLTGWNVEYGTVTDGGGYALFEEDPFDLSSTLSQQFTIPALALELSFDVLISSTGNYDTAEWADAFTACLYDNPLDLNPLIYNPGFDDFFYMDHTGVVEMVGSFDGTSVTLDVSAFRNLDAYLVFDLWANLNDGMTTTVSLDNVNISVIPAPGALLLGLIGTGLVGFWHRVRRLDWS